MSLRYAVHAYAWTTSWSNDTLHIIDHAKKLGFDLIEVPLMEIDQVDPVAIKARLERANLGVCTSTACNDDTDLTGEDAATRQRGVAYLKQCVEATAAMGGTSFSGVLYSALGRTIEEMPGEVYWARAAEGLREVARFAQDHGVTLGLEPINRYETFLVNTCDQALQLRERIGEPNVAIHLDAYHMNIEEEEFYTPTQKAAPHLCHYHLSESHRGTPGTGTVDWASIYRALAESGYNGVVGLESFTQVSDALRAATCIWRPLAPSSDYLLTHGLAYLKAREAEAYG
jgi:D-psicose/D-tagatose/L-ribulose 3-epimerase